MTDREVIEEKYKEVVGRKARQDRSDESLINSIEKQTGEPFVIQSEEEIKPAVSETTKSAEVVKPVKPKKEDIVQQGKGERKRHKVFIKGAERWFTAAQVEMALKVYKPNEIQFPENTEYVTNAKINKCSDC